MGTMLSVNMRTHREQIDQQRQQQKETAERDQPKLERLEMYAAVVKDCVHIEPIIKQSIYVCVRV